MPIPKAVGKLNRIGFNRIARHVAPWLPGFGVVVHRGRRSGRVYRTPVNVFVHDGRYVFAMTYGSDVDWVRNIRAAGECELETRGRRVHLVSPHLYRDETLRDASGLARRILPLIDVDEFLALVESPPGRGASEDAGSGVL